MCLYQKWTFHLLQSVNFRVLVKVTSCSRDFISFIFFNSLYPVQHEQDYQFIFSTERRAVILLCVFSVCVSAMHDASRRLQDCLADMYEPEWFGKEEIDTMAEVRAGGGSLTVCFFLFFCFCFFQLSHPKNYSQASSAGVQETFNSSSV